MRVYSYKTENKPGKTTKRKFWKFKKFKWTWKQALTWAFRLTALGILLIALMFLYYTHDLPDPNKLLNRQIPESTKILARDGSLLYEVHGEYKRTQVKSDQVTDNLKNATIAIEDKNFYKEGGISITGILRSVYRYIVNFGPSGGGGSTLTQQFVKNALLTNKKSFDRKIREAILSIAIDARFSKEQILLFYLNEIPYGRNAYGIEAASQSYFGKSAKDLDLAESAYLAALPQAPSYYNPLGTHRDSLDGRKNLTLQYMKDQGYINADQMKQAQEEKVNFLPLSNNLEAAHFVLYVEDYLADKYGESSLQEGGLKVYTTLDPKLQKIAEQVVKDNVNKLGKKYNFGNAALVAVDPKTGQILAMVGSKDYFGKPEPEGCKPGKNCVFEPNVNVALSQRQPGSSFKPYVYVTAFTKQFGYSPASPLFDLTTNFGTYNGKDYIPHNYNGENNGLVNMRKALAGSLNVPAVKALDLVGVNNATKTAHDLGITSPLSNCGLSLVLGGCEVRLLDHTAAFGVLANGGLKNETTAILKIEDSSGKTLEEYQSSPKEVLDPQAVYELTSIMTDNNARSYVFGSNSPLILPGRTVAAKTGTTQNWHDGWTLGFTPSLAAGVWAGNNDGTLLKKNADGVVVAAPIWHDFMKAALAGTPAEEFTVPSGIQQITVDDASGKLPTQYSQSTHQDTFADYSAPTDYDSIHINQAFDSQTNLPANQLTPPQNIVYRVCTIYKSEKPANPNWEDPVQIWASTRPEACPAGTIPTATPTTTGNDGSLNVDILDPAEGSTITAMPFAVNVQINSPNPVSKVDLSIDGQFVQSIFNSPFTFMVSKTLSAGQHTLAVRVFDNQGKTADTSTGIIYSNGQSALNISDPAPGTTVSLPLNLTAESPNLYSQVNFFYQKDGGSPQPMGIASNISHPGDKFNYSLTWETALPSGNYKIFAQNSGGLTSPKINIIVP